MASTSRDVSLPPACRWRGQESVFQWRGSSVITADRGHFCTVHKQEGDMLTSGPCDNFFHPEIEIPQFPSLTSLSNSTLASLLTVLCWNMERYGQLPGASDLQAVKTVT